MRWTAWTRCGQWGGTCAATPPQVRMYAFYHVLKCPKRDSGGRKRASMDKWLVQTWDMDKWLAPVPGGELETDAQSCFGLSSKRMLQSSRRRRRRLAPLLLRPRRPRRSPRASALLVARRPLLRLRHAEPGRRRTR